jgi:hypothetical protein
VNLRFDRTYIRGTANRRVDVTEFIAWVEACGVDPLVALARLIREG